MSFEDHDLFLRLGQSRIGVELAFDHERAGEAEGHLPLGDAVGMRVVVVEARDVILRDLDLVIEGVPGIDPDEDVVAVVQRRNGQPVEVDVRRLRAAVLKFEFDEIARLHAQRWRHIEAVVGVRPDFAPVETQFGRLEDELGAQHALVAPNLRWIGEFLLGLRSRTRPSRPENQGKQQERAGQGQTLAGQKVSMIHGSVGWPNGIEVGNSPIDFAEVLLRFGGKLSNRKLSAADRC